MKTTKHWVLAIAALVILGSVASQVHSQSGEGQQGIGRGHGFRGGRGHDAQFAADREDFHFLLENHKKISRKVTNTKNGVKTVTESDTPAVATKLRKHVRAMYQRVEDKRAIRMRDPLYAEIFRNTEKIKMDVEDIEKGIRVVETSSDPHVVALIQEHARVVSNFAKYGFDEAHKNHPLPGKTLAADEQFVGCGAGGEKGCCGGKACQAGRSDAGEVSDKGPCKNGECNVDKRGDDRFRNGKCEATIATCKSGACNTEKPRNAGCKDGKCRLSPDVEKANAREELAGPAAK